MSKPIKVVVVVIVVFVEKSLGKIFFGQKNPRPKNWRPKKIWVKNRSKKFSSKSNP